MGTWGPGIFDNDTACDWIYKLKKTCDLSLVEETLDKVLSIEQGQMIGWHAEEALAAAETIASLQGNPGRRTNFTRGFNVWLRKNKLTPTAELARKAILVIDRVLRNPSDVFVFYNDQFIEEWKKNVENLRSRIRC
jgi:hypothetical protein